MLCMKTKPNFLSLVRYIPKLFILIIHSKDGATTVLPNFTVPFILIKQIPDVITCLYLSSGVNSANPPSSDICLAVVGNFILWSLFVIEKSVTVRGLNKNGVFNVGPVYSLERDKILEL